jgi:microcystin-dependent protein
MEGYNGEIRIFAGTFAPQYWAFCQGQLLSIEENPPLFSILGTTYGGNGVTTFQLPNLLGNSPAEVAPPTARGPGQYIICVRGLYPART